MSQMYVSRLPGESSRWQHSKSLASLSLRLADDDTAQTQIETVLDYTERRAVRHSVTLFLFSE